MKNSVNHTSFITDERYNKLIGIFHSDFDAGCFEFYEIIGRISKRKFGSYFTAHDIEDFVEDVFVKLYTQISFIFGEGSSFTAGGLYTYIVKTANSVLRDRYNKKIDTVSTDGDENGEFFTGLISHGGNMIEELEELEFVQHTYQKALKTIFALNSKPYIILGYCFNVLIFGIEANRAERGCSAKTAETLANEFLENLRNRFCEYNEKYYNIPIPSHIIQPLDIKLDVKHLGKSYGAHTMKTFYGQKQTPEKTISDWTTAIRKALLKKLASMENF